MRVIIYFSMLKEEVFWFPARLLTLYSLQWIPYTFRCSSHKTGGPSYVERTCRTTLHLRLRCRLSKLVHLGEIDFGAWQSCKHQITALTQLLLSTASQNISVSSVNWRNAMFSLPQLKPLMANHKKWGLGKGFALSKIVCHREEAVSLCPLFQSRPLCPAYSD